MILRRIALIAVISLAVLAWLSVPSLAARPVEHALTRPVVETVLSNAPRSDGVTIQMDVSDTQWPELSRQAPIIERPGVERWFRR